MKCAQGGGGKQKRKNLLAGRRQDIHHPVLDRFFVAFLSAFLVSRNEGLEDIFDSDEDAHSNLLQVSFFDFPLHELV